MTSSPASLYPDLDALEGVEPYPWPHTALDSAAPGLLAYALKAREVLRRVKGCQDRYGLYDPNLLDDGNEVADALANLVQEGGPDAG